MEKLNDSLESVNSKNLFIGNGVPSIQLLVGMRDLGYSNIQTMCDIIDNSIDAITKDGTGRISIKTNFSNSEDANSIIVIDNGCGMNLETLSKALVFGKESERDDDELGKFGIGLKSAALALGKQLKIITKSENDVYYTGIFDYDEALFKKKDWNFQVIIESPEEDLTFFKENLEEGTGTIVIISKLDRLDYNIADKNKKHFDNVLTKNLGEIFRNFISTSSDDDKIKFLYNGKLIKPIDPMCRDMEGSSEGLAYQFKVFNPDDVDYEVTVDDKKYNFKIICYHVPYIESGAPESLSNMRHTSISNSGFYILRNNRQIQRATWDIFNTKNDEEVKARHCTGNQFRAELYYNGKECDEVFRTDTKKMSVHLPQEIVDKINLEVWDYLRGVQKMHSRGFKKKSKKEVLRDLDNIARKMNNKVSTPTVLKNKKEQPIEPTIPSVKPKDSGIKKEEHPRNQNKKIEFGEFSGESTASFIQIDKVGIKKYVLLFNINHVFYDRFAELDPKSKEFVVHVLHGMALTLYSELYDVFGGQGKTKLIEEFLEKFSGYFRKDSEE
jgi:hypothetical protein